MYPNQISPRRRGVRLAYGAATVLVVALWLLPLFAVMLTSLRTLAEIDAGDFWTWPRHLAFGNCVDVFRQTGLGRYMLNSVIITMPAVAGVVTLSTLAGFALAKYRFRGNLMLLAMFIGGNFVPYQILMAPVRDFSLKLGLYNNFAALILFHVSFQTGFAVFFTRNFIADLPNELIEAARLDGISEWNIFLRIVLPLTPPAIAALAVLLFTFIWNDCLWALVLVQSNEVRPVMTALQALLEQFISARQLVSAAALVAAMPPMIMFFAMQRRFIAGLTLGAIKG